VTLSLEERLIVDSSVAVKWVVPETNSDRAIALLQQRLIAPDLLFSECANVLWKKVGRGNLTEEQAGIAARVLERTDVHIVSSQTYLARAVAIAVELDHPAYDAMYFAVAEDFGLRLVTADDRLVRKTAQSATRFRAMLLPLADISPAGYSA
jgi:predicted nucleic acid-binding protein